MNKTLLIFVGFLLFSRAIFAVEAIDKKQIAEVRERTQQHVPFSLDQTVQTYTKTVHGGVQHIIVKSPGNSKQIKLVQGYLKKLAEQLKKGDFSQSEIIHGSHMPGLTQLKLATTDDIKIVYEELPNGGQIHFSTEYPQYDQALHEWFDAQISEHSAPQLEEHALHHSAPSE